MHTFTYECKKNGRSYEFTTKLEMNAQDEYAWRRGVREYMDNYHAAVTKAGLVGSKGTSPWKDPEEYVRTVTEYCEDAYTRFNAGDVPGTKAPANPNAVLVRKALAEAAAQGVDLGKVDAAKLIAAMIREAKRAA